MINIKPKKLFLKSYCDKKIIDLLLYTYKKLDIIFFERISLLKLNYYFLKQNKNINFLSKIIEKIIIIKKIEIP